MPTPPRLPGEPSTNKPAPASLAVDSAVAPSPSIPLPGGEGRDGEGETLLSSLPPGERPGERAEAPVPPAANVKE